MAKKESVNNYPKSDLDLLINLFKWVGPLQQPQQELIWSMLKKYIDPHHPRPLATCNCNLSYGFAFNKLRDWTSQNIEKFK